MGDTVREVDLVRVPEQPLRDACPFLRITPLAFSLEP